MSATPSINIRRARSEDCLRMLELVQELAVYELAPDEVTVTSEHFEDSGFGNRPVWWAFVAEAEDIIVGFALYYIRFSTWKGQRMYLEDIIVTEAWRNHGIGGMLMEALITEAKSLNLHGISWQVLDWNTDAIRFYQRWQPKFDGEWVNVMLTF